MQYRRFIIENYRAISGPLEVNVATSPLIPIIGINECGKTTILNAIFAFDYNNDGLNEGRHLRDTQNLYGTVVTNPKITAEISLRMSDFETALKDVEEENPGVAAAIGIYRRKRRQFPSVLQIHRDPKEVRYRFQAPGFNNSTIKSSDRDTFGAANAVYSLFR
jgi:predicted ATP-dependent endonuclease of OLD family